MLGTEATISFDKVRELRKSRAAVQKKMLDIRKEYRTAEDAMPADKREEITKLLTRFDELTAEVEIEERLIEAASEVETVPEQEYERMVQRLSSDSLAAGVVDEVEREIETAVWLLRKLPQELRGEMPRTLSFAQRKKLEKVGVYRKQQADLLDSAIARAKEVRRALSVGTDSEGGYTVPTIWADRITESAEQEYGMLHAGAMRMVLESFGKINFPHDNNEADNKGVRIGESTNLGADAAMDFGNVEISPYKYSSRIVRVSYELLLQSGYDISSFVTGKLGKRLGRIFNEEMTTGTGVNMPGGVVTRAHSVFNAAAAGAITWPELVRLYAAIRSGYGKDAQWMFNRKTLGAIMQLRDADNNPIFLTGLSMKAPDTLLGRPITLNDDCPDITTGKKAILFGDFSNYMIIEEAMINARILVERYADVGDVGFVATKMCGGDLVDPGSRPIIAITQP